MKNEFLMASLLCFAGFWGCSQNYTQASSGSTWDETETTALTGRVQDSLGNPLAAARVRLVGSASDSARETISDADGAFSFAGAASGNNYIEVTYRNSLGILRKISVDSSTAPKRALPILSFLPLKFCSSGKSANLFPLQTAAGHRLFCLPVSIRSMRLTPPEIRLPICLLPFPESIPWPPDSSWSFLIREPPKRIRRSRLRLRFHR